jgi:hypothetical protein
MKLVGASKAFFAHHPAQGNTIPIGPPNSMPRTVDALVLCLHRLLLLLFFFSV